VQQTFVLRVKTTPEKHATDFCTTYSKKARHLYCVPPKKVAKKVAKRVAKRRQKEWQKGGKKVARKASKKFGKKLGKKYANKAHCHIHKTHANHQKKNFFLNLSCCCLETGLKPVLLLSLTIKNGMAIS